MIAPSSTSSRTLIAVSSADPNTPGGAKAKFAQDYNAGRYKDVIADAEYLRKFNEFDAQSQLIVGQAYYKAQDYAGCVKYAKNLGGSDTALELQARCAYEIGDEATQRTALETLVGRIQASRNTGRCLLKLAERTKGLTDHNTLDINRIRCLTGNMRDQGRLHSAGAVGAAAGQCRRSPDRDRKGHGRQGADRRPFAAPAGNLAKQQAAANAASLAKDTGRRQGRAPGRRAGQGRRKHDRQGQGQGRHRR